MASLYTRRLIVVATDALCATVNTALQTLPEAGDSPVARALTLSVPLSPTGALPVTHRWCNWQMTPQMETDLLAIRNTIPAGSRSNVRVFDAATNTPEQVLATMGLVRVTA